MLSMSNIIITKMNIDIISRDLVNTYVSLSIRYDAQGNHSAKTMAFDW